MAAFAKLRQDVVDGFWFIPGLVVSGYAALAFLLIAIDRSAGPEGTDVGFGGDAGAARGILETIAGSLITVAGLAFSLTIVVLTLVSSQFSPRALPGLLADRVNQVAAGSFVGIFVYCLLVLRTIRDDFGAGVGFVPGVSVSAAIVLALVAISMLLVFIHHMGQSIQASQIAARIGKLTIEAVDRLHPHELRPDAGRSVDAGGSVRLTGDFVPVLAPRTGYLTAVALERLEAAASASGLRFYVPARVGDFVTEATTLVELGPAVLSDDGIVHRAQGAFSVANERSMREDAAYGIRQLADIAVKALSPGVNDPTTAETCIGYLRAVLERLAERDVPSHVCGRTSQGALVARRRTFEDYAGEGFREIGRYASGNVRVVVSVIDSLGAAALVARRAGAETRAELLVQLACAVAGPAQAEACTEHDRLVVVRAMSRLEAPGA